VQLRRVEAARVDRWWWLSCLADDPLGGASAPVRRPTPGDRDVAKGPRHGEWTATWRMSWFCRWPGLGTTGRHALIEGCGSSPRLSIRYLPLNVDEMFWRALRHRQFDVTESSLALPPSLTY
jgi:hypothetical protein